MTNQSESNSDIFALIGTMAAPNHIRHAVENGNSPFKYVLERFVGTSNNYGISFSNKSQEWPTEKNHRPEEIFNEAYAMIHPEEGYSLDAIKNKFLILIGNKKPSKIVLEEARMRDGMLVGYYTTSPKDGGKIFSPLVDAYFVAMYAEELAEDNTKKITVSDEKENIDILDIIVRPNQSMYLIRDGFSLENGNNSVENLSNLITRGTEFEGTPVFQGQDTDETAIGELKNYPLSLWKILADGNKNKQKDFETWMNCALKMEAS